MPIAMLVPMVSDDERLGRLLRIIRTRDGMTQVELADAAQVPLRDLKRVEAGDAGQVKLERSESLRAIWFVSDGRHPPAVAA